MPIIYVIEFCALLLKAEMYIVLRRLFTDSIMQISIRLMMNCFRSAIIFGNSHQSLTSVQINH